MDRLGVMVGKEILHALLDDLRKQLEALRRERQHQLYAAENAPKGAEDRAKWLQHRATQENRAVYPTPQIEDTRRKGKELNREHIEKAQAVMEERGRLERRNNPSLSELLGIIT
ncbi:MAG: hypothetical protein ABSF82_14630 [Candidatus Bathyarchaeia archaeon]